MNWYTEKEIRELTDKVATDVKLVADPSTRVALQGIMALLSLAVRGAKEGAFDSRMLSMDGR